MFLASKNHHKNQKMLETIEKACLYRYCNFLFLFSSFNKVRLLIMLFSE